MAAKVKDKTKGKEFLAEPFSEVYS